MVSKHGKLLNIITQKEIQIKEKMLLNKMNLQFAGENRLSRMFVYC